MAFFNDLFRHGLIRLPIRKRRSLPPEVLKEFLHQAFVLYQHPRLGSHYIATRFDFFAVSSLKSVI